MSADTMDGVVCIQASYQRVSVAFGGQFTLEQLQEFALVTMAGLTGLGLLPCPGTAAITPEFFVRDYLRTVDLPVPAPEIEPGRMLVGLEAFLETGAPLTYELTEPGTPFGPATFTFTSFVTVDWGDGTTTGPVESTGGAYPNGDLRHVYTRKGDYDIVVTQDWTATWAVGAEGGTITGLQTTGTLPGFPVQEREAVIVGS